MIVSFLRKKTIRGHVYVYEVEGYRDAKGNVRQRVVRYLGPTDPIYGGRGVDFEAERRKFAERDGNKGRRT